MCVEFVGLDSLKELGDLVLDALGLLERQLEAYLHLGSLDGQRARRLEQLDDVKRLLFDVLGRVHRVVGVLHGLLDERHRVRSLRLRIDALVGHHGRDLFERVLKLLVALLVGDLQLALLQYLHAYLGLILGAECLEQVLGLGRLALAHVHEHRVRLEHVVQVGVDLVAPRDHFVLVAGDLEALAALLQTHHGHIGQLNTIRRRENLRHFCFSASNLEYIFIDCSYRVNFFLRLRLEYLYSDCALRIAMGLRMI